MTIPEDARLQGVTAERDAARKEFAWLTAIVEQMPAGVIIVEAPKGRVLTVSEQARKLLNIADGEVLHGIERASKPDGSAYQPQEFPLFRALNGETITTELLEIGDPEGQRVVVNVRAAPVVGSEGQIVGAVSLLEDVTIRAAWDQAEREFVTNAAHELQSPIAAITSAVEALQVGAKDSPERDVFIDHIDRECQRLVRLTAALLTLARAQTAVEEPARQMIDLCPILEKIVEAAEALEAVEGIEFTIDCSPGLALVANRELLEQVLANVVRNAIKYTDAGSVGIEASLVRGRVEISVVDSGIGMSAEVIPRVTERFFRGTRQGKGFGLGLAIVQAALGAMDGTLHVASDGIGRGTTVTISLPLGATRVAS
jgi:signal transduction histidine kinase